MTSNQITQLWETHTVPARHHILIVCPFEYAQSPSVNY